MWDHVIKNGTIVTPTECYRANIYVKDGRIAAITADELPGETAETTDAAGRYVMPGFIDEHCHSRDGRKGAHHKEDFFHSSMAGAVGGITTILEMPNCNPAISSVEALNDLVECITPKAHTDFGVWGLCLGDLNIDELEPLARAGVIGFKFFWGYAIDSKSCELIYNYKSGMEGVVPPPDQGQIYKMFREVAKTKLPLGIHAENFDIVKLLTAEVRAEGGNDYEAMLRTRPPLSEITTIETAISIARALGTHLHVLHLAVGEGVELIRRARAEGYSITAETCPHYLSLTNTDADGLGALIKTYPLVRTAADQELLWAGINSGVISTVASDHAPHTAEDKAKSIWDAPAGIAGIEAMVPLMLDGVNKGKLTINKLAEVLSEQPAKLFGLYPRKGALRVGADADITIVDLDCEYTFKQETMHSRVKISPYNGRRLRGRPVQTILRGVTTAKDGEAISAPRGRFITPV